MWLLGVLGYPSYYSGREGTELSSGSRSFFLFFFFVSRSSKDKAKTFVYDQMTCHIQDGGYKTND